MNGQQLIRYEIDGAIIEPGSVIHDLTDPTWKAVEIGLTDSLSLFIESRVENGDHAELTGLLGRPLRIAIESL